MSRIRCPRALLAAAFAVLVFSALPAAAKTGLPLPRFASLRSDEVNVRTGPGVRYPVEWVFIYRHMPVEIVAEFDVWRKVRDWQGTEGWVHQSMLSGQRTVIVRKGVQPMHREPDARSPVVARVEAKVIGKLESCQKDWCRIEVSGFSGWMRREQFWGVYANEKVE